MKQIPGPGGRIKFTGGGGGGFIDVLPRP